MARCQKRILPNPGPELRPPGLELLEALDLLPLAVRSGRPARFWPRLSPENLARTAVMPEVIG